MKQLDKIEVGYGTLPERKRNNAVPVTCYVCGTAHKLRGFARIKDNNGTSDVPLCQKCSPSRNESEKALDGKTDNIIRRYLDSPSLEIKHRGEATTEQIDAMVERRTETQH
jgi:hypothetical protein